ncbi:hypothetical protein PEL8287_02565 [Roseovarius litorisediminis]|uniref:Uncharacterized protein n=1 Tax=Roseovarius litorisediminis TaxID=1312363 RepID=A0A1Y5T0C3_9RHOB|nr:hypothetical protein PEL8287_02565 [Roseovarius litorisediminis]
MTQEQYVIRIERNDPANRSMPKMECDPAFFKIAHAHTGHAHLFRRPRNRRRRGGCETTLMQEAKTTWINLDG